MYRLRRTSSDTVKVFTVWQRGMTVLVLNSCLALMTCVVLAETPGEHFDRQMKKFTESCAKRTHVAPGDRTCDRLKLKPADPLATEEGRFAHSIKIPNPVPEESGYKSGMTSQEYFEHLCKTEAGEFIYRTAENVEMLYMMRPRDRVTDYMQEHLYAMEDPYGYTDFEAQDPEFTFVGPLRYRFFEMPLSPNKKRSWGAQFLHSSYFSMPDTNAKYERYSGSNGRDPKTMVKEYDTKRAGIYGFTWRGIKRPHDRDLGIAGGELIALDLETKEVLAVRRGFIRSGNVGNNLTGIWWLTGQTCPKYGFRAGRDKDFDFTYWFIGKVLRPVNYEQSFMELTNAK